MNFTRLPDLASRALAGSVVHANDELFAERENLIKPGPAAAREEFGVKGKVYDGWETRRRREPMGWRASSTARPLTRNGSAWTWAPRQWTHCSTCCRSRRIAEPIRCG